jgi:L-ribulose-5-phosphate 4-epimerase
VRRAANRAGATGALGRLRKEVLWANREIARRGLARFTFGNASAIDRESGLVVIKPSGVPYDELTAATLVVTDLHGREVEGTLRPSSDLATHLVLYRAFREIGAVVHTHSHYATVWAQARREIPCLGTTHADHFHGAVPVTATLTHLGIEAAYEANTGEAIVHRLAGLNPLHMPSVLVAGHASFCWGLTAAAAVETASVLEDVARMAHDTVLLNPTVQPIDQVLLDTHFYRKHGATAYYGQAGKR